MLKSLRAALVAQMLLNDSEEKLYRQFHTQNKLLTTDVLKGVYPILRLTNIQILNNPHIPNFVLLFHERNKQPHIPNFVLCFMRGTFNHVQCTSQRYVHQEGKTTGKHLKCQCALSKKLILLETSSMVYTKLQNLVASTHASCLIPFF